MANQLVTRSVHSLAKTWVAAKSAWNMALGAPGGRIVIPDRELDSQLSLVTDGLTFTQLRAKINSALQGEIGDGLELFQEMESKDGRIRAVANTRRLSLTGLDWEVVSAADVQEEMKDRKLADEAADFVRETFANMDSFEEGLEHLSTGIGPNLAVSELVWERNLLEGIADVWPWRLTPDRDTPGVIRVMTADNREGEIARAPKFVVHMPHGNDPFPFRKSLARPQAMIYLAKALAFADWKIFLEIFGMPTRIGTYQPGADAAQKRELVDMLKNVGTKAWGAFSSAVQLQLLESSSRGSAPYKEFIEHCAKETTILWLGGQLTTDTTGGTGTLAAGKVQDDVKDDLRNDDIKREGRTVRRQIIAPMCTYKFWRDDVPLPYFRRVKPETIDRTAEADLFAKAQQAGLKIGKKYAHERLGIPEPEEGDEVLTPSLDAFGEGLTEG